VVRGLHPGSELIPEDPRTCDGQIRGARGGDEHPRP
jgi:hypothetical protein